MNKLHEYIILLIKSAVTGDGCDLPAGFELEQVFTLAKKHNALALVYEGALKCGISNQDPVMLQLFAAYCKALLVSEGQLREIGRIYEAFEREQIDYLPLKGCRMKMLYPKHEIRVMADADILIRMEQYDRIKTVMQALGFTEKQETDHEWVWESKNLHLELHKRLVPSDNVDFYSYYENAWRLARHNSGCEYVLAPEDEWVFLITHFAKHYRDGGIGYRHVTDLWVYRRSNPQMDEQYIRAELSKLHLLEFYDNILRLLAVWFEGQKNDDKTDVLTEFITSSGCWGLMESRAQSSMVCNTRNSVWGVGGKCLFFFKNTFPPARLLWDKYRFLKKAPWLLPAVWVIRPLYKLLFERQSLMQRKAQMDAVSRKKLKQKKQMLNYVGLDYHY